MADSSREDRPPPSTHKNDKDAPEYVARLLKGSSSVFSGSTLAKGVGFAVTLVLSRGLGPSRFGVYSLGLTVLRLIREIGSLGLQNGIVRFGAPQYESANTAKLKGTFLAAAGLGFGGGLVIGAVLFASAPWLAENLFPDPRYALVFRIFACGLPFYIFSYLAGRMARAMGKMFVDVLLHTLLQPAIFLVLASLLLVTDQGLTVILYGFVASTVLAAVLSLYAIARLFPDLVSRLTPEFDLRRLLRFSLPIIGVSLASIGLTYTDRIMLGIFSTAENVGIYQDAAQTSVQLRFMLGAITATFSPIISDLYQNGKLELLDQLYADTVRWIFLATLPAAAVLLVFAPQIMGLFGPGFREGKMVLRILAVAYFVVAGVGSVGHMLQMSDHQDVAFAINVTVALLNVALNWLMIRWWGAEGAAVATGISHALGNVGELVALYYFLHIQPFRWALWKPTTAVLAAGGVGWGVYLTVPSPAKWLIGIPALLLVYAAVVLGLGLHDRDRPIAQNLWSQVRAALHD